MTLSAAEKEIAIGLVNRLLDMNLLPYLYDHGELGLVDWYRSLGGYDKLKELSGFSQFCGATRACFSHNDLENWVIKVDFRDNRHPYSQMECDNYALAEEEGLEYYFAATYPLCEIEGIRFFIQERAECDEESASSRWFERLREYYDVEDFDNEDQMFAAIWGEIDELDDYERVELLFNDTKLLDFIQERRINDLHEGNYGIIGDHLVIVDFSGYRG